MFRGQLKDILKKLDERFIKCHRSFIVNADNITEIDTKLMNLRFANGLAIDFAANQLKKPRKLVSERQSI